jgi:hypothetical protein
MRQRCTSLTAVILTWSTGWCEAAAALHLNGSRGGWSSLSKQNKTEASLYNEAHPKPYTLCCLQAHQPDVAYTRYRSRRERFVAPAMRRSGCWRRYQGEGRQESAGFRYAPYHLTASVRAVSKGTERWTQLQVRLVVCERVSGAR